jgi:hypothetical protein
MQTLMTGAFSRPAKKNCIQVVIIYGPALILRKAIC